MKFKIFAVLFILGALTTGIKAIAEEKTKEYNESWPASGVQTLEVVNKFGEVKVNNDGGDQITIDVVITVEAPNEKKANDLLEQIEVNFSKNGGIVKAQTKITSDFKSRQKFSIDYTINVPSDKNLNITNKYGNTIVNELNANGDFDIRYGNFTANILDAPENGKMDIYLAYGKSNVSLATDLKVKVSYSTMNFSEIKNLELESKYSVINIEEGGSVLAESKYDTFNFEEVQSVSSTTKYSHFKIEELKKSLKIDAGYGGIRVDEVGSDFESISITNSYGQIKLGLDDKSYSLDASCNYCGVSYNEDDFSGDKIKEKHTQIVKGKVGTGNGGTVYVRSRYGEIKLRH
ncbi:MAG: hypothetical protein HN778_06345 [Prolixibacteraceae bacterium]|jgi:hypothetical protein|nr:hypothetical protein [Prolixibacteraceae bacterium]MBT7394435.1 hypothetical protein [Prolixibacteraceae bacterium]